MDRITAMNAFVRVVEAGTFTKAADTLDVPNATITRLIQQLEQDLRVRLLHRTTRSVTVTPEGAIYYERVVRLLADLADIESSTTQSLVKPSGKARVDAAAIATRVIVGSTRLTLPTSGAGPTERATARCQAEAVRTVWTGGPASRPARVSRR